MPLANKIDTNRRRAAIAEPRGGGGSAAVVLAVALLAGFLFIGGAAAIYLSNPPGSVQPTDVAIASGSPTLPPFVQPTATPSPSPTFILLPSESPSFSPLPTSSFVGPTPPPTIPVGPTAPPSTTVTVKFNCAQLGAQRKITCSDNSSGAVASREWDFGDGSPKVTERNPTHSYPPSGPPNEYTVTLVVTGTDGQQYFKQKQVVFDAPATPTPSAAPTTDATATPTPSETVTGAPATVESTATPSPNPTGTPAP